MWAHVRGPSGPSGIIFLSCAITLYDAFRSPLSLQVPESVYRHWRFLLLGFPLGKEERGRVREGERASSLEEGPPPLQNPFWLHFGYHFDVQIVLKNSVKKRAHGDQHGRPGYPKIDKKHENVSSGSHQNIIWKLVIY